MRHGIPVHTAPLCQWQRPLPVLLKIKPLLINILWNIPHHTAPWQKNSRLSDSTPGCSQGAVADTPDTIEEGDIVAVYTSDGRMIGVGHYQIGSITVRILAWGDKAIDEAFFSDRLNEAFLHFNTFDLTQAYGAPAGLSTCSATAYNTTFGMPLRHNATSIITQISKPISPGWPEHITSVAMPTSLWRVLNGATQLRFANTNAHCAVTPEILIYACAEMLASTGRRLTPRQYWPGRSALCRLS